jgi:hypothetical protein
MIKVVILTTRRCKREFLNKCINLKIWQSRGFLAGSDTDVYGPTQDHFGASRCLTPWPSAELDSSLPLNFLPSRARLRFVSARSKREIGEVVDLGSLWYRRRAAGA